MISGPHRVIHKQPLVIFDELSIPIPMSHSLSTKAEAVKWMMARGMQIDCKVIPEAHTWRPVR